MLPEYIIEELLERERREKAEREAPRLELPLPEGRRSKPPVEQEADEDRGVTTIELW